MDAYADRLRYHCTNRVLKVCYQDLTSFTGFVLPKVHQNVALDIPAPIGLWQYETQWCITDIAVSCINWIPWIWICVPFSNASFLSARIDQMKLWNRAFWNLSCRCVSWIILVQLPSTTFLQIYCQYIVNLNCNILPRQWVRACAHHAAR